VPRYYFDVREGGKFTPDHGGLEFDSLDGAERAAAEIGRDRLPKGEARAVKVELRNEHRQRVLTVTVSMEIDRVEPPPEPSDGEDQPLNPLTAYRREGHHRELYNASWEAGGLLICLREERSPTFTEPEHEFGSLGEVLEGLGSAEIHDTDRLG
jgi:hypothetical protein